METPKNNIAESSTPKEKSPFKQHAAAILIAVTYAFFGFVFILSGFEFGSIMGGGGGIFIGPVILLIMLVSILEPVLSLLPLITKFLYATVTSSFSGVATLAIAGTFVKYVVMLIMILIPTIITLLLIKWLSKSNHFSKLVKKYLAVAFFGLVVWGGVFFLNGSYYGIPHTIGAYDLVQTVCDDDESCIATVLADGGDFIRKKNGETFPYITMGNYQSETIKNELSESRRDLYCKHVFGNERNARQYTQPGSNIKYTEVACRTNLGFTDSFSVEECIISTEKRFYSSHQSDAIYYIEPCATAHLSVTPLTREILKRITSKLPYSGLEFSPQTTKLLTTETELIGVNFVDTYTGNVVRSVTQYPSNAQPAYREGSLFNQIGNYDDINNQTLEQTDQRQVVFFGVPGLLEKFAVEWTVFSESDYQPKYSDLFQVSFSIGDSFFLVSGFDTRGDLHDGNTAAESAVLKLAEAIVRDYAQEQMRQELFGEEI